MEMDKSIVEKSKSLVWAKFGQSSLGELRLVEAYLSQIDPRDRASVLVSFPLAEYSNLLGIEARPEDITKATERLMSHIVTIQLQDGWEKYVLFPYAHCKKDKAGQYTISIRCNRELESVFFDIANNGYIKYALRTTMRMKHRYSVLLYSILKDKVYKGCWDVSIEEFKEQLGVEKYPTFRELNRCVIQPTLDEVNEVSDIAAQLNIKRVRNRAVKLQYTIRQKRKEEYQEEYKPLNLVGVDATGEKKLLELIRNYITEKYPSLNQNQDRLEEVSRATLRESHRQLIENSFINIDNPGGYLWRVLPIGDTIGEYIPGLLLLGGKENG